MKQLPRLLLALAVLLLLGAYFAFDLGRFFSLDYFRAEQQAIMAWRAAEPLAAALLFLLIYIVATALSLPGAAILTLVAGAVFGLVWGTVLVSIASTVGATLAFLMARFLMRDWVQGRFGEKIRTMNERVEKDGAFYLFTLRLVPVFPFFVINLAMGLTPIRTWTFFWVSQLGMLAGTLVYVNAGTQLAQIDSLRGILSPALLASFALLGLFPLAAKQVIRMLKGRRVYKDWQRPKSYDRNLVVIGAGSAGLVTSYIAAALKAKVTLIEKHRMGGDCLNTGCVPSKALIRSAKLMSHIRRAKEFGIKAVKAEFDFADVMGRVHRVIKQVEPHDSAERYRGLGVEVIQGTARITSPWSVDVETSEGKQTLTTRNIVIATGAKPRVPEIPGIEQIDYLTSDTVWSLREQPKRLLVLGGGPIGSELTQAFARLGSQVTQVESNQRLLMREDPEVSEMVAKRFHEEGIDLRLSHRAVRFELEAGEKVLIALNKATEQEVRIPFDQLLVAVGRSANLQGFGLQELGIPAQRTIETNEFLQTLYPNIYAAGDVAGPYQFTHTAAHQAWYAAVNALFDPIKKFRTDYSVIPWSTFVDPEVARVGLNETEAKEQGIPYEVTTYGIDDLDRAIADEEAHGMIKVLTVPGKDKILGVTIVGEHAGDLLAEYVLAMRHNIGLNKILGTIHVYPTLAEANKYVAGNWKRAHVPTRVLAWVERFHAWRRGEGKKSEQLPGHLVSGSRESS